MKVKRGEFYVRDISSDEVVVNDVRYKQNALPKINFGTRYLELLLVYAERAWALAMEKKSDDAPRSKFYFKRRLHKATIWADKLEELCNRVAMDKTKLEASVRCFKFLQSIFQLCIFLL
jgi:hypothetical protein